MLLQMTSDALFGSLSFPIILGRYQFIKAFGSSLRETVGQMRGTHEDLLLVKAQPDGSEIPGRSPRPGTKPGYGLRREAGNPYADNVQPY